MSGSIRFHSKIIDSSTVEFCPAFKAKTFEQFLGSYLKIMLLLERIYYILLVSIHIYYFFLFCLSESN